MAKEEIVETVTPSKIYVNGDILQKSLYERVKQIENVRAELLREVSDELEEATPEEGSVATVAAGLMIVLEEGYGLSARARRIQAAIQRAAEFAKEHRELSRFGRTVMGRAIYELTWSEADRFGI